MIPRLITPRTVVKLTFFIANATSGAPLTVRSGRDNSLAGINGDTADVVGDWKLGSDRSKQDQMAAWFSQSAFAQNAPGTFGTSGIGAIRGPGFWNVDFTVQKQFRFAESQRVEVRGSFFNLFNHANLGNPNTTQLNSIFGQITSTTAPRVAEVGLR